MRIGVVLIRGTVHMNLEKPGLLHNLQKTLAEVKV